jgi:hypothetical protein
MTLPLRVMIRSTYRDVQTCALQVDSSRHSVTRRHREPLWLARGLRDALPIHKMPGGVRTRDRPHPAVSRQSGRRRRGLIALKSVTDTGCTEPLIRWRGGVGAGRRPGAAPHRATWLPNGSGRREQWPPFSSSSMTSTTRASASGSSTSRLSADERVTGPLTAWPARSAGPLCPAVRRSIRRVAGQGSGGLAQRPTPWEAAWTAFMCSR